MTIRFAITLAAALSLAACSPASDHERKVQLEAMYESDQMYRVQMQEVASSKGPSSPTFLFLWARQEFNDWLNLRRLERLMTNGEWPRRTSVGDKASMAAFLVVQHASLDAQKRYLPLIQAAVSDREARADELALLEDRILMGEGKKQRYGSQLQSNSKGGWEFYPIEDEEHVDERRRAVGLPALAEYAKQFGFEYQPVSGRRHR